MSKEEKPKRKRRTKLEIALDENIDRMRAERVSEDNIRSYIRGWWLPDWDNPKNPFLKKKKETKPKRKRKKADER